MRTKSLSNAISLLTICLVGLAGCDRAKTTPPTAADSATAHSHGQNHDHGHDHGHHHGHDHGHHHGDDHGHGPHGGHIVDLGTEDYHAELMHDEASHQVAVHLLGADAATPAPIEASSVTIHTSVDGEPTEYTLPAVPQPGEAAGKSSYFELSNESLQRIVSGQLQSQNAQARLSITIDGMPYAGAIDTEIHENQLAAGHSHAHDDALVWSQQESKQGYDIALGHHGVSLLAGSEMEPAVQITRDGKPVADAQVFNALLDDDGETVLADEVATVYEPTTEDEPAHYAQGGLKIPAGTRDAVIRYRIVLPEGKGEHTFDLPVTVK